ncbi:MAG: DUF2809 domain-containing protein [Planctomycetota bacterium]
MGLGSRRAIGTPLEFVAVHAGDVLWATCLYLVLAFGFPRCRCWKLFAATLLISLAVECSQAWHPAWLDELRRQPLLQLVLGTGWQWLDLPRYLVGALLAWALDRSGALGPRTKSS